jgi:hypothetical protein
MRLADEYKILATSRMPDLARQLSTFNAADRAHAGPMAVTVQKHQEMTQVE